MSVELEDCCSCGDEEMGKLGYYNEDECRYWFVECGECGYRTNDHESADSAVDEWNDVEEGEEDSESEEDPQTIATLVRMLDETRTAHEALKEEYIELDANHAQLKEAYQLRKVQNMYLSYGGTNPLSVANLVALSAGDEMVPPLSGLKDIALHGKDVVPELEARIKNLEAQLKNRERQDEVINNYKGQLEKRGKELGRSMERSFAAEEKLKDAKHALYLIDIALVSQELAKDYEETIDPIMSVQNLLDGIRQKEWPPERSRGFDTILGEIIWLASPYGPSPSPGLYLRAMQAQLTTHSTKDAMIKSAYGLAMSKFGQGSRGFKLAWEALGRPGETVLDGRRART